MGLTREDFIQASADVQFEIGARMALDACKELDGTDVRLLHGEELVALHVVFANDDTDQKYGASKLLALASAYIAHYPWCHIIGFNHLIDEGGERLVVVIST